MFLTRFSQKWFLCVHISEFILERLGWVDLDLGSSPGWLAASVATYCPSRMVEHPKSNSTQSNVAHLTPQTTSYANLPNLLIDLNILLTGILGL